MVLECVRRSIYLIVVGRQALDVCDFRQFVSDAIVSFEEVEQRECSHDEENEGTRDQRNDRKM